MRAAILGSGLIWLSAGTAATALEPVNQTLLGGLAAHGYDVVAYFTDGGPVAGAKEHQLEWNGAVWRFASAEHRALFARQPERYAPAYGGYCAWAVAHGSTADIDAEAWTIHEGRLYLNYDREIQAKWLANRDAFIAQADANWPNLVDK